MNPSFFISAEESFLPSHLRDSITITALVIADNVKVSKHLKEKENKVKL